MVNIGCYNDDADRIEQICEEKGITEPEFISAMLDILDSEEVDLDDWI